MPVRAAWAASGLLTVILLLSAFVHVFGETSLREPFHCDRAEASSKSLPMSAESNIIRVLYEVPIREKAVHPQPCSIRIDGGNLVAFQMYHSIAPYGRIAGAAKNDDAPVGDVLVYWFPPRQIGWFLMGAVNHP